MVVVVVVVWAVDVVVVATVVALTLVLVLKLLLPLPLLQLTTAATTTTIATTTTTIRTTTTTTTLPLPPPTLLVVGQDLVIFGDIGFFSLNHWFLLWFAFAFAFLPLPSRNEPQRGAPFPAKAASCLGPWLRRFGWPWLQAEGRHCSAQSVLQRGEPPPSPFSAQWMRTGKLKLLRMGMDERAPQGMDDLNEVERDANLQTGQRWRLTVKAAEN